MSEVVEIKVRLARGGKDAEAIHALGSRVPELAVSAEREFMSLNELRETITLSSAVFLVAERGSDVIGFVYAAMADIDRSPLLHHACLVYLAVASEYRRQDVATWLYDDCIAELQRRGVTYVYAWAHLTSGVREFLAARGFAEGKQCVWMDKEI